MSRSNLPQSPADWFAATFTLATVVALLWVIAGAPQEVRGAPFAAQTAAQTPHVYECNESVVVDCFPAQRKAPEAPPRARS
jgi:hypothetical protein